MTKKWAASLASVCMVMAFVSQPADGWAARKVNGQTMPVFADFVFSRASSDCGHRSPINEPLPVVFSGQPTPPVGQHAVGWMLPSNVMSVGPAVYINSPADLTQLSISILSFKSGDSGVAEVDLFASGDPGYWSGRANFAGGTSGTWSRFDLTDQSYAWTHYSIEDVANGTAPNSTLQSFAASLSGDPTARVSLQYGCAGGSIYVDDLQVGQFGVTDRYNFEGFLSSATLAQTRYAVKFGESTTIIGDAWDNHGTPLVGRLEFYGRKTGTTTYTKVGSAKATLHKHAILKVAPQVTTTYRVTFPGDGDFNSSTSPTVTVRVQKVVRASINSPTLRRGQPLTVRGVVGPHRRGLLLQLQRWNSHRWVNWSRGRTGRNGIFSFRVRPASDGVGVVRVVARKGNGTDGGVSPVRRFTVTSPAPPPPPPSEPPPPPPPIIPPPPPIKT